MNVLAVDTSSGRPSAVVVRRGEVIAEVADGSDLRYSESLFPAIERLVEESGIALNEIDAFGVVRGPGSFTGIRVGMAAVEGLAFAFGKPAFGVSALHAIVWQHAPGERRIVGLIPARRGRFFGGVYRRRTGDVEVLAAPRLAEAAHWLEKPEGGTVFTGAGAETLVHEIAGISGVSIHPVAPQLARSAAGLIAAGHGEPVEPLYLEPTSAEEKLAQAGEVGR